MARIGYMAPEAAEGKTKELYSLLENKLPRVFNVFQGVHGELLIRPISMDSSFREAQGTKLQLFDHYGFMHAPK